MGGRGQYHRLIVWRRVRAADGGYLIPYVRCTYWNWITGTWERQDFPVTVSELYGGHATWVAEQIEPRMRRAA